MKILFIASECAPLVKTGGLGDVIGALPAALAELGHDVRVALPFYSAIDVVERPSEMILEDVNVWLPEGRRSFSVWRHDPPGAKVVIYLFKEDDLFARTGVYDLRGVAYEDNPIRYGYFALAALWALKGLAWFPDVYHCHDWQGALVPVFLKTLPIFLNDPDYQNARSLMTIHNLLYQGAGPLDLARRLGLPPRVRRPDSMEHQGGINLLKGGLVFADALSTVSPTYAHEIQTPLVGCGLHAVTAGRAGRLYGIMNGIDVDVWNPAADDLIPARYTVDDLSGKAACKRELQLRFHLKLDPDVPLAGMVARLVDQKGYDLMAEVMARVLEHGVQVVLLGQGEERYEYHFEWLAEQYPQRLGVYIGYEEPLAHLIEAGADMFFMPSRFEPCGLNQLYSMRYGAVPITHRTGGLADSVIDASSPEAIDSGAATGFSFDIFRPVEFLKRVKAATEMFTSAPDSWAKLVRNGMKRDWSWRRSALRYDRLMRGLVEGHPPSPEELEAH